MDPMHDDFHPSPSLSYETMNPPHTFAICSINPTDKTEIGIFPSFEAGPLSPSPASTTSRPYSYSIHATSSPHSTHGVSQDDSFPHLFTDHVPPPSIGLPLPAGGNAPGLIALSQSPVGCFPCQSFEETWQSSALSTMEYALSMNNIVGHQANDLNFAPQPPSLALDPLSHADIHALPPTLHSSLLVLPSSSTPVYPYRAQPFVDHDGVMKYQCPLCPMRIRNRLSNLQDHIATHDHNRKRFDCNWPGCNRPFTRERDLRRHIKKDHHGLPLPSITKTWRAASKRKGV